MTNDAVSVTAEAADVDLDAALGDEAAVIDAELAVDVHRPPGVRGQEGEEGACEVAIVARVVVTARMLAGAAEEVPSVVVGNGGAAAAAEVIEL